MNPEIQDNDIDGGRDDVTTIYPPHVDCSVSSNVKCMLHQFVDAAGDMRLIFSLEPGVYEGTYTDEFPAAFHTVRVLTGAMVFQGQTIRIEASAGSVHTLGDEFIFIVSTGGFTQLEFSDARPRNGAESLSPDAYRNSYWVKATPKPKGPTPPGRRMMVNIASGK